MSKGKKTPKDLLAGKKLIGFARPSMQGARPLDRASSAKVTTKPLPHSVSIKVGKPELPRSVSTKVGKP